MIGMGLAHARRDKQANRKMAKTGNEMNFGAMFVWGFGCLRLQKECNGRLLEKSVPQDAQNKRAEHSDNMCESRMICDSLLALTI